MLLHDSKKVLTSYLNFYYDTQQNNFYWIPWSSHGMTLVMQQHFYSLIKLI
ncbi:hypothetical protein [Rickettsia tamurae]|uniref:hypothetical protein n=1 Tax=Rickettsia tamurae TaxID=334545 RepID=UPI000A6AB491|nr:hypothetical protein [Rickettsia tamurae]